MAAGLVFFSIPWVLAGSAGRVLTRGTPVAKLMATHTGIRSVMRTTGVSSS
ncbi:MAG TPA: hypothetical protein VLA61_10015 [Ideonella sp.]|uniref:hypothetical protein n=1 Tax=Ideonella sp. TaxID=1929293 RepID=UPI002CF6C8D4|nr:hypothetical protein [Ideonella sp.]HSI48594.1 hypothetical protein [Ideonella sp.]